MESKMEVSIDEMLILIGKQQLIIERQNRAIEEITRQYNQKMEEAERAGRDNVIEMKGVN